MKDVKIHLRVRVSVTIGTLNSNMAAYMQLVTVLCQCALKCRLRNCVVIHKRIKTKPQKNGVVTKTGCHHGQHTYQNHSF